MRPMQSWRLVVKWDGMESSHYSTNWTRYALQLRHLPPGQSSRKKAPDPLFLVESARKETVLAETSEEVAALSRARRASTMGEVRRTPQHIPRNRPTEVTSPFRATRTSTSARLARLDQRQESYNRTGPPKRPAPAEPPAPQRAPGQPDSATATVAGARAVPPHPTSARRPTTRGRSEGPRRGA